MVAVNYNIIIMQFLLSVRVNVFILILLQTENHWKQRCYNNNNIIIVYLYTLCYHSYSLCLKFEKKD